MRAPVIDIEKIKKRVTEIRENAEKIRRYARSWPMPERMSVISRIS
jgi:hypothetical protein